MVDLGTHSKNALRTLTRHLVPAGKGTPAPAKTVAVVVPVSNRPQLLPEEEISVRHLVRHLGRYDKYLVAPRGLGLQLPDFKTVEFSGKFFGSMPAYNRLMYLPRLYELFSDYEYILMYHLDSLVFSDELLAWCQTGVDYIGAPWLPCPELPWVTEPAVGNGGFALMKVKSILTVLYRRYQAEPSTYWKDVLLRNFARRFQTLEQAPPNSLAKRLASRLLPLWREVQTTEPHRVLNDLFWAQHARRFMPEFRIPDWQTALKFAFESCPRQCYAMNERRLPFGCHAWAKFDRSFWEPHLLKSGIETSPLNGPAADRHPMTPEMTRQAGMGLSPQPLRGAATPSQ